MTAGTEKEKDREREIKKKSGAKEMQVGDRFEGEEHEESYALWAKRNAGRGSKD